MIKLTKKPPVSGIKMHSHLIDEKKPSDPGSKLLARRANPVVKIVVETRLFTADFPWKLGCK